jgi:EpsI family protein
MNKRLLAVSVIIFIFALYLNLLPFHEVVPLKKTFTDFPLTWMGWSGKINYFNDSIMDKLKVSEYILRDYKKGDRRVTLYVGYYSTQREGAQIHSPRHCLPGSGWSIVSEKIREMDVQDAGRITFVESLYQKNDSKEVFVYWYRIKDTYITNEYILKLYMVLNSLKYRRNDAAFIRLSAPVTGSVEDAVYTVEEFMRDFLPVLKDYLPE